MMIGTGCSLGPEGPSVEIGATCSRIVGKGMSLDTQKQLLAAGAAAGVAAGFNAPISGVFFAIEIANPAQTIGSGGGSGALQKSALAATLLASVISALVARVGLNESLALRVSPYELTNPLVELPLYLGLGIVSAFVALSFKYMIRKSNEFMNGNIRGLESIGDIPHFLKPLFGGILCGITGYFFPQILFFGYAVLDQLVNEPFPFFSLISILAIKIFITSFSLATGLVGGLFAPSLFLGAAAGASYQILITSLLTSISALTPNFPVPLSISLSLQDLQNIIAPTPAYAMVGAAAVLSAMMKAPLTSSLLLFELTRDYDILLPLMASAGIGSLLVELIDRQEQMSKSQSDSSREPSSSATSRTIKTIKGKKSGNSVGDSTPQGVATLTDIHAISPSSASVVTKENNMFSRTPSQQQMKKKKEKDNKIIE